MSTDAANPFAEAEAWTVSTLLPVGNHVVEIREANDASTNGGDPQVHTRLVNADGDIQDWVYYRGDMLGKVVALFDAAGIPRPGPGEFDPNDKCRLTDACRNRLLGKRVGIVVREEDKYGGAPGEKVRRVQGYLKADGVAGAAPPPATTQSAPVSGGGQRTFGDDDIPF